MPPAETPDFDSMSPEEVMAWMESLAKRQGASEGFTTDANVEIAEIDPSMVEIDEPGYVPYGEESSKPAARQEQPAPPAPPEEPAPQPEPEPEPLPQPELLEEPELTDEDTVIALEEGGLAWLESLAADQTAGFPQMDLEALSAEIAETEDTDSAPTNPLDWLESLAEGSADAAPSAEAPQEAFAQEELAPEEFAADTEQAYQQEEAEPGLDLASIADPMAAGIDPMLWLESLARRQGAKSEELITSADIDVPVPEEGVDTSPGYNAFTIEDETRTERAPETQTASTLDPAAWLESMATASAALEDTEEEVMSDDQIQAALAAGADIPPDQMEKFFERQLERGLETEEAPFDDEYDPDAPPVPAELPDWLLEQVQPPDEQDIAAAVPEQPALVEDIVEPPTQDLPDWLAVEDAQDSDLELEGIFDSTDAGTDTGTEDEQRFYSSDPWVQAFAEEATLDPDEVPEWYERNLRDPERIAAVEQQLGSTDTLADADLPQETELPHGELQAVPDWMSEQAPDQAEAELIPEIPDWLAESQAEEAAEALPDWLAAADVEVAPDEIPDWLRDTVETDEMVDAEVLEEVTETVPEAVPEPVQEVIIPPAPPSTPAPPSAPPPAPAPTGDIAAVLESARTKVSDGDLEGSLLEYERVIRANAALDQVVDDLTRLAEQHRDNPAIYRVMGDGLMRQGKLQAALDTYRKALNQL